MSLPGELDAGELVRIARGEEVELKPVKPRERAFRVTLGERHQVEVVLRLQVTPRNGRPAWYKEPADEEVLAMLRRLGEIAGLEPVGAESEDGERDWLTSWEARQEEVGR